MSSTGTDANLLKEEARIKMKREANAARRERFMNARKRVMGIDVAALNAQVAEKKALVEAEKEADRKFLFLLNIYTFIEIDVNGKCFHNIEYNNDFKESSCLYYIVVLDKFVNIDISINCLQVFFVVKYIYIYLYHHYYII